MKTVKLFGYSDDNIEIRGDLGDDEFGAYGGWKYLHFNDGTVIRGGYGTVDGKGWAFEVVKLGSQAKSKPLDPELEDGDHFSDVLEVAGNFTSVACYEGPDGITDAELRDFYDAMDARDYDFDTLRKAHAILTAK